MRRLPAISPDAVAVARVVHRIMRERGADHVEVSLEAGLSKDYVRDLFRAKSKNPKQAELQKLASTLNVDVSTLTEVGAVAGEQVGGDLSYTDEEVALIGLWRLLSDDGQEVVLTQIAKLVPKHPRRRQANDI